MALISASTGFDSQKLHVHNLYRLFSHSEPWKGNYDSLWYILKNSEEPKPSVDRILNVEIKWSLNLNVETNLTLKIERNLNLKTVRKLNLKTKRNLIFKIERNLNLNIKEKLSLQTKGVTISTLRLRGTWTSWLSVRLREPRAQKYGKISWNLFCLGGQGSW